MSSGSLTSYGEGTGKREMPSKHGPKLEKFYHTTQWMKCWAAFVALNHGKCQICGKRGNLVNQWTHLNEENVDDPYISLNFDNLELLCRDCHNKIHADHDSGREDKPTLVEFIPDGNVIVREKNRHSSGRASRHRNTAKTVLYCAINRFFYGDLINCCLP